jgi:XTP/dITP diphosphohydrolase|tara:strand:- start:183 stop:770 length:588 start_codon:yes stop_codon:yes gene_type:complete
VEDIIFFSNNKKKIEEIDNYFSNLSFKVLNLNDFKEITSPEETGSNFEENAKIKSQYAFNIFKKPSFADDSGICIECLNGMPGVNSKKFLEKEKNIKNILSLVINSSTTKNNFKAFFQTSICLTLNEKTSFFFNGKIKGAISKKIRGLNGFGYDPIFVPNGFSKTFAEMTLIEKNKISHRAIALQKLKNFLFTLI